MSSPVSRLGLGNRAGASDQIEGLYGSAMVGMSGQWRPNFSDGGGGQQWFYRPNQQAQQDQERMPFTPLVGRFASAFPACEAVQEGMGSSPLFLTDLMRGLAVYELNLKLFAPDPSPQGGLINRFS